MSNEWDRDRDRDVSGATVGMGRGLTESSLFYIRARIISRERGNLNCVTIIILIKSFNVFLIKFCRLIFLMLLRF